ncbi:hypothetical protein CTEN210_12911 [Chaetoceros tenuissimus]|uniref:Uncharacterized protein n=1 Tax=Chaetoceros tenuissimus TaxID=426638 RepID=A0AAD3HAI8_9STRA|nr:hypothetical protein CTEN210_12911 [Chaetoceros tenuissimus]
MATAGERYSERTGNIWSYAFRQDMTGLRAAIQRGVDVNMINTVGWTPVIAAAAGGRNKALRYLVKQGADLSIADKGGSMASHHAAKNGHAHALKVLQELGCDVTKVRLSQAKGKEVRDVLVEAYKKAGRHIREGDDEYDSDEEEKIVGYNRKQAKSTAFWGPRRTPISAKIKKKIIKNKRIKKKDRLQEDDDFGNDDRVNEWAIGNEDIVDSTTAKEANQKLHDVDLEAKNELSYKETVQMIKRNQSKKQKRRQQNKAKREEEAAMERNNSQAIQDDEDGNEATSIESDDKDDLIERPLASSFAAFNIDSDSSCSCSE